MKITRFAYTAITLFILIITISFFFPYLIFPDHKTVTFKAPAWHLPILKDGNIALYDDYIEIEAENAILMDAQTGSILWEKNSWQPVYPASITKIMTGIVAIEYITDLGAVVEISKNASGSNHSFFAFQEGDRITLLGLLKAALISSHNNATIALAEYVSGNTQDFVDIMNDKARDIGAYNTNFENTSGLDSNSPGHKTTAYDVALMARYAMQDELFREIVGTASAEILINDEYVLLENTNRLVTYDYIKGIKTGYTENAGFCLAIYSDLSGRELIAVVLNSSAESRESDALKLIYWADNNIKTLKIVDSTIPLETVEVGDSTRIDIDLYAQEDISATVHISSDDVKVIKTVGSRTVLPADTEEIMGEVTVSINGSDVGSTSLVSKVAVDEPVIIQEIVKDSRQKRIISLIAILAFYFFIIIFIIFKNLFIKKYKY